MVEYLLIDGPYGGLTNTVQAWHAPPRLMRGCHHGCFAGRGVAVGEAKAPLLPFAAAVDDHRTEDDKRLEQMLSN